MHTIKKFEVINGIKMSKISLMISPITIDEITKSRYFKHELIYQTPFVYCRMPCNGILDNDKLNREFLKFLKSLNKTPIYFIIGELTNHQNDLDFAKESLKLDVKNAVKLTYELPILNNQLYCI